MVTGASTADVVLILVDARNGIVEQTRRHAFLASLLGVPHIVLCVNKMDLVGYDRDVYESIVDDFREFATKLTVTDLRFVPVSALAGDNVVEQSAMMTWYRGPTVLGLLEEIHVASDRNLVDCRLPVQYVIRPHTMDHQDYRGYAGQIAGGTWRVGDEVVALPSGFTTTVTGIDTPDGPVTEAVSPMSITLLLDGEIDISRGDMICRVNNHPHVGQDIEAMICWMAADAGLTPGRTLAIKHTTRWGRARVERLQYRLDVNTLHRDDTARSLELNEIGRVSLRATVPLFFDEYARNRTTGSFILVDEATNATVGAGMILGPT